jgi:hypothetical protein
MKPVYNLMDQLIKAGALSGQKFTVDPRPLDPNVPSGALAKLLFKVMYSKQNAYEEQWKKIGLINDDGFT